MKKTLATIGIASGLAFAGLGAAQVASAQTSDDPATDNDRATEESDATDAERGERDGNRGDRGDRNGRQGRGKNFEAVAAILGLEADEIRAQLQEGMSLADIAEANDVDPAELIDAMVASVTEKIEAKVAEGDLTEEEAAENLAAKTERIENKVYDLDNDGDGSDNDADADVEEEDVDDEPEVEGEGS